MNKKVKISELFDCKTNYIKPLLDVFEFPWQVLPYINRHIDYLIKVGVEDYTLKEGNILIGKNVKIAKNAVIIGPAIIGSGTEIRPGAYIRGNCIIGENCVIGNSCELKNCILLNKVQVPHYNYVGDSILGNYAHMGAGAVCSNLKSDGKNVVIKADASYDTSLRKIGGFLGDNADIGCGCVLNPGTVVGKNTSVYPLTCLRGVYPANCIVKSVNNIVKRI